MTPRAICQRGRLPSPLPGVPVALAPRIRSPHLTVKKVRRQARPPVSDRSRLDGDAAGTFADAELYFTGGDLEGLKLIGFGIWERRGGTGRNVTCPGAPVLGERRAPRVRSAAPRRGCSRPGPRARPDPHGLRGVRTGRRSRELTLRRARASRCPPARGISFQHDGHESRPLRWRGASSTRPHHRRRAGLTKLSPTGTAIGSA